MGCPSEINTNAMQLDGKKGRNWEIVKDKKIEQARKQIDYQAIK